MVLYLKTPFIEYVLFTDNRVTEISGGPYRIVEKQVCKYVNHIEHNKCHGRELDRAHWESREWKSQFFP